jgi:hypothetical protein
MEFPLVKLLLEKMSKLKCEILHISATQQFSRRVGCEPVMTRVMVIDVLYSSLEVSTTV